MFYGVVNKGQACCSELDMAPNGVRELLIMILQYIWWAPSALLNTPSCLNEVFSSWYMQWQWSCHCKLTEDSLSFCDMVDEIGLINKGDQFGRTPLVRVLKLLTCNCCMLWSTVVYFCHRQCSIRQLGKSTPPGWDDSPSPALSWPVHINFYSPGWHLDTQKGNMDPISAHLDHTTFFNEIFIYKMNTCKQYIYMYMHHLQYLYYNLIMLAKLQLTSTSWPIKDVFVLPNWDICFPIGGEWVSCGGSKLINSKQNSLILLLTRETTTWTFVSHVIRSCSLKACHIFEPAGIKQTVSLPFF